jgi:hypothetical protein
VAALSYAGQLTISIQVDGAVADLQALAAGVIHRPDQLTHPGGQQRVGAIG